MSRVIRIDEDKLMFARADLDEIERCPQEEILEGVGHENIQSFGSQECVVLAHFIESHGVNICPVFLATRGDTQVHAL